VRVDSPDEVCVSVAAMTLAQSRAKGKALMQAKQTAEAAECYNNGLRSDEAKTPAVLLSNRAQALLKLEDFAAALADAAAALLLRPQDSKAAQRYSAACAGQPRGGGVRRDQRCGGILGGAPAGSAFRAAALAQHRG